MTVVSRLGMVVHCCHLGMMGDKGTLWCWVGVARGGEREGEQTGQSIPEGSPRAPCPSRGGEPMVGMGTKPASPRMLDSEQGLAPKASSSAGGIGCIGESW